MLRYFVVNACCFFEMTEFSTVIAKRNNIIKALRYDYITLRYCSIKNTNNMMAAMHDHSDVLRALMVYFSTVVVG